MKMTNFFGRFEWSEDHVIPTWFLHYIWNAKLILQLGFGTYSLVLEHVLDWNGQKVSMIKVANLI